MLFLRIPFIMCVVCSSFISVVYAQSDFTLTQPSSLKENFNTHGIYRSPFMHILNSFGLSLSTGFNQTYYSYSPSGLLLSRNGKLYALPQPKSIAYSVGDPVSSVSNLFYKPHSEDMVLTTTDISSLINTDTINLKYRALGTGIPITFTIDYKYSFLRLGIGFVYEFQRITSFSAPDYSIELATNYPYNWIHIQKYFLFAETIFMAYGDYQLTGNVYLGLWNGSLWDQNRFYGGLGFSVERVLSEYLRLFVRPSFEFKSFVVETSLGTIQHSANTFGVNFGFIYHIPELPQSPIENDKIRMKHVIRDPESGYKMKVRGQPFYKKQNPDYGEDYKRLEKHKWKNYWKK